MDNTAENQETQPQAPAPEVKAKKADAEFSMAWHLKVLAVIYVILGILYVVLKFTLK